MTGLPLLDRLPPRTTAEPPDEPRLEPELPGPETREPPDEPLTWEPPDPLPNPPPEPRATA